MQENQQILTVARMRAEAEDVYGQKLGEIEVATLKIDGGFVKDDGASVRKVRIGLHIRWFHPPLTVILTAEGRPMMVCVSR